MPPEASFRNPPEDRAASLIGRRIVSGDRTRRHRSVDIVGRPALVQRKNAEP
jgi:hypothetical protein